MPNMSNLSREEAAKDFTDTLTRLEKAAVETSLKGFTKMSAAFDHGP